MKTIRLWTEFLTLFVFVPLFYWVLQPPVPKIPVLGLFFLCALAYMVRHHGFGWASLFSRPANSLDEMKWIFLRSLTVAFISLFIVTLVDTSLLFSFPRQRPVLWMVVMVLYPLLSAFPQEFLYRTFLLTRYEPIIPNKSWRLLASIVTFSLLHIIFDNWLAVLLTLPAGWMFTRTYDRTNSLWLASLEHALYGCIVFTSGLGHFFYRPS